MENTFNEHPDPAHAFYFSTPIGSQYWSKDFVAYSNLLTHAGFGATLTPAPSSWHSTDFIYTYRADGYPLTSIITGDIGARRQRLYIYH